MYPVRERPQYMRGGLPLALSSHPGCSRSPMGSLSFIRTGHKQGHLRPQQGWSGGTWDHPTPEGPPMGWMVNCCPQGRGERPPILTTKVAKDKIQQTIRMISFCCCNGRGLLSEEHLKGAEGPGVSACHTGGFRSTPCFHAGHAQEAQVPHGRCRWEMVGLTLSDRQSAESRSRGAAHLACRLEDRSPSRVQTTVHRKEAVREAGKRYGGGTGSKERVWLVWLEPGRGGDKACF